MAGRYGYAVFGFCLLNLCSTAQAGGDYVVRNVPSGTGLLEITLRLPDGHVPAARRLSTRGRACGLDEQVIGPRCGDVSLERNGDGSWSVPHGCVEVTWRVRAPAACDGARDASLQASMSFPEAGWVLLSEPTALLRLEVDGEEGTLRGGPDTRVTGASRSGAAGWRVPAAHHAPDFYVVGDVDPQVRRAGAFEVRHMADDPREVARLGLVDRHADALDYLAPILFPDEDVPDGDRGLLVMWVGIEPAHGRAGGAAGSRSFVANYLTGNGEDVRQGRAVTLMIAAHEQFHQLVDVKRAELPGLPAWINESLAQFYGLRAMSAALGDDTAAQALRDRFIDPHRLVEHSLATLEELFATDRPRALDLSYGQGASFWAELDVALKSASGNRQGLDGLLPDLLRQDFPKDGTLPDAFRARLGSNARMGRLIAKYFPTP